MKSHNPIAIFAAVISFIAMIAINCVLLFTDVFEKMMVPYWIIMGLYLVIFLFAICNELLWQKRAKAGLETYGDAIRQSLKQETLSATIKVIMIVFAVIGAFVWLCIYNPQIGIPVYFGCALILGIYPIYKVRTIATVEKYIESKSKKVRKVLRDIHNLILETVPDGICWINSGLIAPTYAYTTFSEGEYEISTAFGIGPRPELIIIRSLIGGKTICVYPMNISVFTEFADRISEFANNGYSEIHMQIDKIDFDLIRDIVRCNKDYIIAEEQRCREAMEAEGVVNDEIFNPQSIADVYEQLKKLDKDDKLKLIDSETMELDLGGQKFEFTDKDNEYRLPNGVAIASGQYGGLYFSITPFILSENVFQVKNEKQKKLRSMRVMLWGIIVFLTSLPVAGEINASFGAFVAFIGVLLFALSLIWLPFEIIRRKKNL